MNFLKGMDEYSLLKKNTAVNGRNPAAPGMYKTLIPGYLLHQLVSRISSTVVYA